jgi:hypothetical protein
MLWIEEIVTKGIIINKNRKVEVIFNIRLFDALCGDKVILQSLALPPGIMAKYKEPANTHFNLS